MEEMEYQLCILLDTINLLKNSEHMNLKLGATGELCRYSKIDVHKVLCITLLLIYAVFTRMILTSRMIQFYRKATARLESFLHQQVMQVARNGLQIQLLRSAQLG